MFHQELFETSQVVHSVDSKKHIFCLKQSLRQSLWQSEEAD